MKIYKYTTEHLVCYLDQNELGEDIYLIYEKDNNLKPMAIYENRHSMKLASEFPIPETDYIYFKEMCEIVSVLYDLGE